MANVSEKLYDKRKKKVLKLNYVTRHVNSRDMPMPPLIEVAFVINRLLFFIHSDTTSFESRSYTCCCIELLLLLLGILLM